MKTFHPQYHEHLPAWSRARDVLAGEDAVKAAGDRYLPRLESQSDAQYDAYRRRAAFFNATARTADALVGLIFRRAPFLLLPDATTHLGRALHQVCEDVDLLGNTLAQYAKEVVGEIIAVGRAGTLIDWDADAGRAYFSRYRAEDILDWRLARINGRSTLTRLVLDETGRLEDEANSDAMIEQVRVLKLVDRTVLPEAAEDLSGAGGLREAAPPRVCVVEIWQRSVASRPGSPPRSEWVLQSVRVPRRTGQGVPWIPFVFHGPRHARPAVDKMPLADMIALNLDHYRLDADYKHGMHFTALPTAWVSGFEPDTPLRIGSGTAWVTSSPGASAGFLEFKGHGLSSFERALERDERLMAILGSRLLEGQKKVGETAEAIELRQSGQDSILASIALSGSASLTGALRWAWWWHSDAPRLDASDSERVAFSLNTDFSARGFSAAELQAIVRSWQADAISRDSMLELLRRGEILPEGRTNEEELRLLRDAAHSSDTARTRAEEHCDSERPSR